MDNKEGVNIKEGVDFKEGWTTKKWTRKEVDNKKYDFLYCFLLKLDYVMEGKGVIFRFYLKKGSRCHR